MRNELLIAARTTGRETNPKNAKQAAAAAAAAIPATVRPAEGLLRFPAIMPLFLVYPPISLRANCGANTGVVLKAYVPKSVRVCLLSYAGTTAVVSRPLTLFGGCCSLADGTKHADNPNTSTTPKKLALVVLTLQPDHTQYSTVHAQAPSETERTKHQLNVRQRGAAGVGGTNPAMSLPQAAMPAPRSRKLYRKIKQLLPASRTKT